MVENEKVCAATLNEEILLCLLNIFCIFKRVPAGFLENCANQFFSTSDLHSTGRNGNAY